MESKKRLIDANAADVERIPCYYGGHCRTEDVQEWLNEQPTVDAVEVVHGRWVRRIVDHEKPGYWKEECSICGFDGDAYAFLYCPNCGAKMDGERKDNV